DPRLGALPAADGRAEDVALAPALEHPLLESGEVGRLGQWAEGRHGSVDCRCSGASNHLASAAMARALTAVGALLALALLGLGLAVYLGRDEGTVAVDNLLSERITRAIGTAEDRGQDVDLGRIAKFDWDEVLLVDRDTTRAQISKALGYEWKGDL